MRGLAKITSKYIGRPYDLGHTDCFSLVYEYLQDIGVDVPDPASFDDLEGLTFNNYAEVFSVNSFLAMDCAIKYFGKFLESISPNYACPGDILILKREGIDVPILGIDGGNGIVATVACERGVITLSKREYSILKVFRWATR